MEEYTIGPERAAAKPRREDEVCLVFSDLSCSLFFFVVNSGVLMEELQFPSQTHTGDVSLSRAFGPGRRKPTEGRIPTPIRGPRLTVGSFGFPVGTPHELGMLLYDRLWLDGFLSAVARKVSPRKNSERELDTFSCDIRAVSYVLSGEMSENVPMARHRDLPW